jgi:hypothetical protein
MMQSMLWKRRLRTTLSVTATASLAVLAVSVGALALAEFGDVPDGHIHEDGIEFAVDAGITVGCGDGSNYCPDDPVTRAQMATFMHRLSGNAPGSDPSVNAATLDGLSVDEVRAGVALETHADELGANVNLDGATSNASAEQVLSVSGLSAGEYVVMGQALGSSSGTDGSRLICRLSVDGSQVSESFARIGGDGGNVFQATLPISGQFTVDSGTAEATVECHAENVTGSAPRIAGTQGRTHMSVVRVGGAS